MNPIGRVVVQPAKNEHPMSLKIDWPGREIEKGVRKTFLFPAGGPTPVKLAVLPILFSGSWVSVGLHLVFGFQSVDFRSLGAGIPGFFDPLTQAFTHVFQDFGVLGVLGQVLGLPPIFPVQIELLFRAGGGEEQFFGQPVQFLLRVKLAKTLDDDFAVLVVAWHEVGAMRIKVFDVKETIGAHGTYAVGRFSAAVTGGEDRLLGLVV